MKRNRRLPLQNIALFAALLLPVAPASAQTDGSVSVMADVFPDTDAAPGRQMTTELRARVLIERTDVFAEHVRLKLSGYADGLFAERREAEARDAIAEIQDVYVEFFGSHAELRVGTSRLVWGRLDEFQPNDVVNPIDLSRFLLEGRTEARLAVPMVRGRIFFGDRATVEAVVVPKFRASVYDQLDEATSPFNLATDGVVIAVPVVRREPDTSLENLQGGVRTTITAGRVDIGITGYRGFRSFPLTSLESVGLVESFPRFTMIGADFETVGGDWGIRGEFVRFVDDALQSPTLGPPVEAKTAEGGFGVDRRAGSYRIAANLLWSRREQDEFSVVFAAERSFARETRRVRAFAVYNPEDETAFIRGIASFSVAENVWLEGSGGLFTGAAATTLGPLENRDFAFARLKVFF